MAATGDSDHSSLTRWYIDTRQLTASTSSLPLLETLKPEEQEAVQKFLRLPDRHMSLASNLLKYLFIHRACRIPWTEISISRTPKPHGRPCFIASSRTRSDGSEIPSIEFNVSHQASFVALAGCIIPSSAIQSSPGDTAAAVFSNPQPSSAPIASIPQVGIDITCVDEPGRRSRDNAPQTAKALSDFVDIFASVFSRRELDTIKQIPSSTTERNIGQAVASRLRVFYAYWALKEAYIKMTGEALLAPWLRELEFTGVVAPDPVKTESPTAPWSEPYTGVQTWLYGKRVEDVRIELVALERDYLIATAARGGAIGSRSDADERKDSWKDLEPIDIESDISPCARGQCGCLD